MLARSKNHLSVTLAFALITVAAAMSTAVAQEPDPVQLLQRMSAELAGMDRFIVSGDAYMDASVDAGLIIEHSSDVTMRVRKPDAMRMTQITDWGTKELYFDGGMISIYNDRDKFFAQKAGPKDIDAAATFAIDEVGIDAPLLDFVANDFAQKIQEDAEQVEYMGQSVFRGKRHEHIAIRTPEADIQIWMAAEGRPLPSKMSISSKWEGGSPRFVVFLNWDTAPDIPDGEVTFSPPEGATQIQFVVD